jgi:sortase A
MIETDLKEDGPPVVVKAESNGSAASVAASATVTPVPTRRHRRDPEPVRQGRPGLSSNARTALAILLAIGCLAVWLVAYARVFSGIEQEAAQRQVYDQFREELAKGTAPVGGAVDPGAPVAVIDAPGAGIDNVVAVEGTTSDVMRTGPGHLRSSPLPGQPGSSVLFGRSVTFGGPFSDIAALGPGDTIAVTTGQGQFNYIVETVRRDGDPLPVPLGEGEGRLTLVTAESTGMMRGWVAQTSLYVDARLEGKAVPVPPGRPAAVSTPELMMQGSSVSLVPLVFWLQLLLLVVVAWVFLALRWNKWQAWLVSVPVFVAAVWGTTSAAFVLLPNLL